MAGSGDAHLRGGDALLRVEHLVVDISRGKRKRPVQAVSDVSFDLEQRETLGLVGESGCGKSTTGRAIIGLQPLTAGSIRFKSTEIGGLGHSALRQVRSEMQMIFQDPIASLNPRRSIGDSLKEPLTIWNPRGDHDALISDALDAVGLDPKTVWHRRPHEFSGGQCQRICIARCLLLEPQLLVCDEPVSALDVSIQAQILNLLDDLKARYGLTLLFISHDLSVVKKVSDLVAVMYLGKLCEMAPTEQLFSSPAHPYTALLLAAVPVPDPNVVPAAIERRAAEIPSPIDPPSGCRFRTRCPRAREVCATTEPKMERVGEGQFVACHFPIADGDADLFGSSPEARVAKA
jgi:peptide/nickel transport system ATP-binding protein